MRKDARFRVIHQKNKGVSCARNRGIKACSGKYITFLDGDDVVDLRWFENWNNVVDSYGLFEMINFSVRYTDERMTEKTISKLPVKPQVFANSNEECVSYFWNRPLPNCVGMCTRFVLKEALRDIFFDPNLKIGEDTVVVWDLISKINTYIAFEYQGYYYRNRSTSVIHTRRAWSDAVLRGQIVRLERVFLYYRNLKGKDLYTRTLPILSYSSFFGRLFLYRLKILPSLSLWQNKKKQKQNSNSLRLIAQLSMSVLFLWGLLYLLRLLLFLISKLKQK